MPCFSFTRGILSPPSSLCPFSFKVSASCCSSHHGLARPLRALPARGGTQLGAQLARMGCAGICRVSPIGELAAKEFVFFVSKLPSGLALSIPSFFVQLLEGLGPQPLLVVSCFILQAAIVAYLHGMSMEATLLPASSSSVRGEG
jgi:NO-binding membrane sensor protein with MHYT domain